MRLLITTCVLLMAAVISSCGGDKEEDAKVVLSQTKLTMKVGDYAKLQATGVPGASWSTDEYFIADVSGGNIQARHVGTTIIRATYENSVATCEVIVEPKTNMLLQPILKFGASPEEIRALETRPYSERIDLTTLYQDVYTYTEDNKVVYDFKKSDDKMKFATQEVTSELSLTDVYAAILERFEVLKDTPVGKQIFYHPIQKYYMVLSVPESGYIYMWSFSYSNTRWWEE